MDMIHIADVISLLGLPSPHTGQSSYYVQCPCCDETPRKMHLNINLKKDVFRCPRCGVSGGIFDLYSLYTGVSRQDARNSIAERLRLYEEPKIIPAKKTFIPAEEPREYPMTDIGTRHATYTALLQLLTLSKDHRNNLRTRGLSDAEIDRLEYRTTPIMGLRSIAKTLLSQGKYLAGVPGFYRDESDEWTFIHEERGILIPVRDINGKIQGLQIRRDNVSKRKFRWISSADKKDGCRAEGWTHLAGENFRDLILTEGPMKADVIHALTGQTILAVPGVNALTKLEETLLQLRDRGLASIMTAFDMDFSINPHVQNGFKQLLHLLEKLKFQYGSYVWDPQYKGLDDYVNRRKIVT